MKKGKNINNIILIILIAISVVGCSGNKSKFEGTPTELTKIDKKVDFWDGDYAYEILDDKEVWLTNVEEEDSEDGNSKGIEYAKVPEKITYNEKDYTVTGIGKGAFSFCDALKEVSLPDSIREIDEEVFYDCKRLEKINFPNELRKIGNGAFTYVPIAGVILGDNVISIKEAAFGYCHNLKSADLPASLENIEGWAFSTCEELEEVTIRGEKSEIEKKAFIRCESLKTFYVPKESLEYYQGVLSEYDAEVKMIEE